ncbi:DUF6046 domain-containing protein [Paludibacter sp.]|uniref:DUF6046 domain-containing protein n=1 Tax=Paludibacter sp. TaxID=1898105 RepID=UPI001354587A|nr:DUF6046 domain-containing protein [Paludibacter sp.]MTK53294.1 hypothetical protein [Paludibacter sp.]
MSVVEIEQLAGRFKAAFGFVTANIRNRTDAAGNASVSKQLASNISVYVMDKNTDIEDITLSYGNTVYSFGDCSLDGEFANVIATAPMISFKRSKRLVTTPIDNTDIEVVERYSTEPYEMTWRGLLIDMENHSFPLDKMETLNQIFEVNDVWNVASKILNKLKVSAIYIKDISIEFVEGYEDTVSYTMTTRAMRPVNYQIINNN